MSFSIDHTMLAGGLTLTIAGREVRKQRKAEMTAAGHDGHHPEVQADQRRVNLFPIQLFVELIV